MGFNAGNVFLIGVDLMLERFEITLQGLQIAGDCALQDSIFVLHGFDDVSELAVVLRGVTRGGFSELFGGLIKRGALAVKFCALAGDFSRNFFQFSALSTRGGIESGARFILLLADQSGLILLLALEHGKLGLKRVNILAQPGDLLMQLAQVVLQADILRGRLFDGGILRRGATAEQCPCGQQPQPRETCGMHVTGLRCRSGSGSGGS